TLQYWVRESRVEAARPSPRRACYCSSYGCAFTSDVCVLNFTVEDQGLRFPGGGRMRLKAFLKRLYEEYENDAVADNAAALSYYFVFALFPFLFFLATLTAYVPYIRRSVDTVMERAHAILPGQAMGLIDTHLRELVGRTRPHLLTLGLLAT